MSGSIPFEAIRDAALSQADRLLREWLPNGIVVGREFKVGNLAGDAGDSLSVNLTSGKWADFAGGGGYDLIDLRAAMRRGNRIEAARELGHALGIIVNGEKTEIPKRERKGKDDWQPQVPPPAGAKPDQREFDGYTSAFQYCAADDTVLFYVRRRETETGKEFHPLTYGTLNGKAGWHWKAPAPPRPLSGLNRLSTMPDAPVLLCEGEKAADAAQQMFPDYACTSWCGGTGSVDHADWTPLADRKVIIWPDADAVGAKAAEKIVKHLPHARRLRVDDLDAGFDAADIHPDDPDAWLTSRLPPHAEPDFGESLPFTMFADIHPALDAADFVKDLLIAGSLVVVYGEPGCGKTFWTLDLALHVAAGRRWRDRQVDQGAVIYLALEGGPGIRNRITAARERLEMPTDTPMILVQSPVDLCTSDADVAKVVATIKTIAHRVGIPVRLIVVDTLSRAFGGGNENAPEDMGALVANSDTIRDKTGACVLYVHHCGKDAARGSRGHSSLKAATDTEIEVTCCEKVSTARVGRQRDLEGGDRFAFQLNQVSLGINRRGKPVTSCIVVATEPAKETTPGARLSDNEKVALRCLEHAMKAEAVLKPVFDDDTEGLVIPALTWRRWFYREGKPDERQDTKLKAFNRARDSLLAKDLIGSRDDFVWPKGKRT